MYSLKTLLLSLLKPRSCSKALARRLCASLLTCGLAFGACANTLRVGVQTYSPPWYDGAFVDETLQYLAWKMPQTVFKVHYLSPQALQAAIDNKSVDLVASNATLYLMNANNGVRDLATLVSETASKPNHAAAATIIVKKNRTDLIALKDLKDKSVAIVKEECSPGFYEVQRALSNSGYESEDFFSRVVEVPTLSMRQVLMAVKDASVDAGIIRACYLEDLWCSGNENFSDVFRVINQKSNDGLACAHSTVTYPGWTLMATDSLDEATAREITALLLTKPVNAWGQIWSLTTDFTQTNQMLKTLKIGPYSYLNEWSIKRFISAYWHYFVIAAFLLLGLILHGIILEKLVRRRTEELIKIHTKQKQTEQEALAATERMNALERLGAVGQISTIVAHDMKQPLASIQNLSRGILRLLENEDVNLNDMEKAVESINDQALKAGMIIDRVRHYSHGRTKRQSIRVDQALSAAIDQFKRSSKGQSCSFLFKHFEPINLTIDPIDLELIVLNLMSNAVDASMKQSKKTPTVTVFLTQDEKNISIQVCDNGPALTDEQFNCLGQTVLKTTKTHGLGLGLMIVRSLAENYLGSLNFYRNYPCGTIAEFSVPHNRAIYKDSKS